MLSILFTAKELALLSLVTSLIFGYTGYTFMSGRKEERSERNERKERSEIKEKNERKDHFHDHERDYKISTEILFERAQTRTREANKLIIENNEKEQDLNKRIENLVERENNLTEYEKDLVKRENYLTKKYQDMEDKEQFLNKFEQNLNARREFMREEELLKEKSQPTTHTNKDILYKDILYVDYKDFFILSGLGTRRNKDEIKKLGGNWTPSQSFWIFNNSEKDRVQNFLNSL